MVVEHTHTVPGTDLVVHTDDKTVRGNLPALNFETRAAVFAPQMFFFTLVPALSMLDESLKEEIHQMVVLLHLTLGA
jgi:hypothetical protein